MTFWHALSWGLPAGVVVAGSLAAISDDPQIGPLTNIGLAIALLVAVTVMFVTRQKR